jgi:hypothetical protein
VAGPAQVLGDGGSARITSPAGWTADAEDPAVDGLLSTASGRAGPMSAEWPEVGTEYVRYRPNLLIETPSGTRPYVENDWVGGEIRLGGEVVLRIDVPGFGVLPCAGCYAEVVHGGLVRAGDAVVVTNP